MSTIDDTIIVDDQSDTPKPPKPPKHAGGRPLKFPDPKALEKKINEYFAKCDEGEDILIRDRFGKKTTKHVRIPYTIEDLAICLDCDPKTIRNYGVRDEFFPIISRVKARIHASWIRGGLTNEYNNKMAALILAANAPGYNIHKKVELGNQDGGPLTVEIVQFGEKKKSND